MQIITACIRRMREGNIFSLFTLAPHLRSGRGGGVPIPGPDRGGETPSQVQTGEGTPSQVWMGGYPFWEGCTPSKIRGGYLRVPHPDLGWGVPWGIPHPRLDGVPPRPRLDRVPPHPRLDGGVPPVSKASTYYMAGSVPLA